MLSALVACVCGSAWAAGQGVGVFAPGARVLFQGDSITDGNRGRSADPNHILGHGYVFIIAARNGAAHPERHMTFMNRGISGNRLSDLAARWASNTLQLKPTVLSILIGVNDIGSNMGSKKPFDAAQFEADYDKLLAETEKALPGVKLVLCDPFVLPGKNTQGRWSEWTAAAEQERKAVARLGAKHHAVVVHFQKVFDEAVKRASADDWIWDGVHPTYAGHQLMADEWERAVSAAWPEAGGSQGSADRIHEKKPAQ
jgi:lysophospholipase L1-like esterase